MKCRWVFSLFVIVAVTGCPFGDVVFLPPADVVGENSETVLYTSPLWLADETASLYRLDLDDGASSVLMENLPNTYGSVVSDGEYVAWIDTAARDVKVRNLSTGTVVSYFDGLMGETEEPFFFTLAALRDGTLVTHYPADPAITWLGGEYRFGLVDLATGEQEEIDDAWLYGSFAFNDGWFALLTDPTANADILGLELSARLDLVNRANGERITLGDGLRVDGSGGELFMADDLLVWQEFKPGGFDSRVRVYDLDSKTQETLIDTLNDEDESAWVIDFDGDRLLVQREPDRGFLYNILTPVQPVWLDVVDPDGNADTIATTTATLYEVSFLNARFVGPHVVWIDDDSDEIVIHDTQDGSTRRVSPAPEP